MKARIYELRGKYYGTSIEIDFEDGHQEVIKLWDSGNFEPSERWLNFYGYTKEQWDSNELVDNGWGTKSPIKEMDLVCDSHFESDVTYKRALAIVDAINKSRG